jgi:lipoprotein-releasing system ATP-binding protein
MKLTHKSSQVMIGVKALTKTFPAAEGRDGTLRVLRGLNLSITKGEILAIVGASGAGKSTLLHILGTLDRPTSGSVMYEGMDVFTLSDEDLAHFRNKQIGFVFQFHHLLPEFTALENVAMPALIAGEKLAAVRSRALELLREVGLANRADQKPPKLSGGEQQRVAVARALMNSPKVVLADEPSGNLDSANARNLHRLLWTLSRSRGQTIVVVTHNEALAKQADRVVRIVDGVTESA